MGLILEDIDGASTPLPLGDLDMTDVEIFDRDPSTWEVTKAAFQLTGPLFSFLAAENLPWMKPPEVEGYDALGANVEDIAGFELQSDSFMNSKSPEETELIKKQLIRENENRRMLANAGGKGWLLNMSAGLLDPAALALNLSGIGMLGKGATALRTFGRTAASVAVTETMLEAGLHATQKTRTIKESAANVLGASLFAGLLHGSWHKMTRPNAKKLTDQIGKDITAPEPTLKPQKRTDLTAEDYELVGAMGLEKIGVSPEIRLMNSDSLEAKIFVQEALESALVTKGHKQGKTLVQEGGATETRIKQWDRNLYEYLTNLESHYADYRGGQGKVKQIAEDLRTPKEAAHLSWKAFDEEVGLAAISGDKHAIPQVQAAAQELREKIFDPLYNQALELGMTKADALKTAQSYFTRMYDVDRIKNNRTEWDGILDNWLRGEREVARQALPDLLKGINKEFDLDLKMGDDVGQTVEEAKEWLSMGRQELEAEYDYSVESIKGFRDDVKVQKQQFDKLETRMKVAQAAEKALKSELDVAVKRFMDFRPDVKAPEYKKAVDATKKKITDLNTKIDKLEKVEQVLKSEAKTNLTSFFKSRGAKTAQKNKTLASSFLRLEKKLSKVRQQVSDAQAKRETVFDDLKKAVDKTENVKTGSKARAKELSASIARLQKKLRPKREKISALTRETDDILSHIKKARERISKQIEGREAVGAKLKGIKAMQRKLEGHELAMVNDDAIPNMINEITDHITGTSDFRLRLPFEQLKGKPGPMQARTLLIPDKDIWDFMVRSSEQVATRYVKSMAADVELTRTFGDYELKGVFEKVDKDYNALTKAATTDKEIAKIKKQHGRVKKDIEGIRDLIRGTYGMPKDPNDWFYRASGVMRDVNFVTMLGKVTVSSFPDVAMHVVKRGLISFGNDLYKMAKHWDTFKIAAADGRRMAAGLDMALNGRAMSMADLADRSTHTTSIEKGASYLADKFSKVSLIAPWNAANKQFASVGTADKILRDCTSWAQGKLPGRDITRLAQAGINKQDAIRIAKQFEIHGDKGDINLARGDLWEDKVAFETFRGTVLKIVDATIVTPGKGELALWSRTTLGKVVTQFKAFTMSTHSKVLLANLQYRDRYALSGFLLATALGYGSYALKEKLEGRKLKTDPMDVLAIAMDKSGTMGLLFESHNLMSKATSGGFSANRAIGVPPHSKYAARNFIETIGGPSVSTVSNMQMIASAATKGDFTTTDLHRLRRMIPYQNLFYMSTLFNEMEKGIARKARLRRPKKRRGRNRR